MAQVQDGNEENGAQLVSTFSDPYLNMTLLRIKEQFDREKNPEDIRIESNLADKVIEAYEKERKQAEVDLDSLAVSIARDYWGITSDSQLKISLCGEGRCPNPDHTKIVPYERQLNEKLLERLRGNDYELTQEHRKQCGITSCKKPINPLISFVKYTPRDNLESILQRINVRTKGDDRLAAKIADGVCGINSKVRPGSIHSRWDPRDFRGCQIVLRDQDACYEMLDYIKSRPDIRIPEPREHSIDDYFAHPKMTEKAGRQIENPYKAIHVHILYGGIPIELQLVPESVLNNKEFKKGVASHGYYAQRQNEARRTDPLWNEVFQRVSDIFNPNPRIRKKVSYR